MAAPRTEPGNGLDAAAREIAAWDAREIGEDYSSPGYTFAYKNRLARTLAAIAEVARPGASILDVAGASGNYSIALARAGYSVTWNDLREEFIPHVTRKKRGVAIQFMPGEIGSLAVENRFDVVFAGEVIEHVAHPDRFLKRLGELVRGNGHVVVTTPSGDYFRNNLPRFSECHDPSVFEERQFGPDSADHIFLLCRDELDALARHAGLRLVSLLYLNNPLTSGHVKTAPLLARLPRRFVYALDRLGSRLPAPIASRIHAGMLLVLQRISL